MERSNAKDFYENIHREVDGSAGDPKTHAAYKYIKEFIENYDLYEKKCLEIGSSKGIYQDIVRDYTGLDIIVSLKKYYHKPFFVVNFVNLPSLNRLSPLLVPIQRFSRLSSRIEDTILLLSPFFVV